MSSAVNNSVLIGRLTSDPELRTTTNNISVTSFTIAVRRTNEITDFIDIVAWRSTADFVTRYFRKGSMIAVQGSIQTRNYEDKNGNKRKAVEVVADNVAFVGDKKDNEEQKPSANASYNNANLNVEFENIEDDDTLPF